VCVCGVCVCVCVCVCIMEVGSTVGRTRLVKRNLHTL